MRTVQEAARSAAGPASDSPQPERPDVFLSYSRKDEPFAREPAAALTARDKDVWVDWEDIEPSANWWLRVEKGIESATAFVVVLSPDQLASEVCARELAAAGGGGKRIVPLLRRDVGKAEVPEALAQPNWILARETDDFEAAVERLIEALDTDLDWLDRHARLLVRAREWDHERHDASFLLRGRDLEDAEGWLAQQGSHREGATTLQADFVVASRSAARRRGRIVLGGVLVALAVAVILGVIAWIQRGAAIEQSKISRSRELAVTSVAQHELDPRRSLLMALEAIDTWKTPEADAAVRRWLLSPLRGVARGQVNDGADVGAISPDGSLFVASGLNAAIVAKTATGEVIATLRSVDDPSRAVFSPDGKLIATSRSADYSGTGARIWRAATGQPIAELTGRRGEFNSVAFSRDAKLVVTTGTKGQVRLWQTAGGKQVARFSAGAGDVNDAAFSPDGRLIVSAGTDGKVRIWRAQAGKQNAVVLEGHHGPVNHASFSPDGKMIVSAGNDRTARTWDPFTGKMLAVLRGHAARVNDAVFSPDGKMIATVGDDGLARIWNAISGRQLVVLKGHGRPRIRSTSDDPALKPVLSASFSPDAGFVITVGGDQTARLWQTSTGAQLAVQQPAPDDILSAAFGADGEPRVVTGSDDGSARVWQLPLVRELRVADYDGDLAAPVIAAFTSDGALVATENQELAQLRAQLWHTTTGNPLVLLGGRAGSIEDAALSVDGKPVFSADGDRVLTIAGGLAHVLRAKTGEQLAVLDASGSEVIGGAFSPRGDVIATIGDNGGVNIWRADTGQLVAPLAPDDDVQQVFFSPDGTRIATLGLSGPARIWSTADWKQIAVIKASGADNTFQTAALSPDGTLLATIELGSTANEFGAVRLWRTATGDEVARLNTRGQTAIGTDFSPDGSLIVAAGSDRTARIWRTATLTPVAVLAGHDQFVTDAGFSPDGHLVVTAGEDRTARLYETANGEELGVLRGHQGTLLQAGFSPNGKLILTASVDGTARVYSCAGCGSPDDVRAEATRISGMTPAQRKALLKTASPG